MNSLEAKLLAKSEKRLQKQAKQEARLKKIAHKISYRLRTMFQIFWDFLTYQHRPQADAVKFRVGYNF
jgi:hypothetical protein